MCGIAGIFAEPGKQVDGTALEKMGKILQHRGPDNFGLVIEGHLGMSHNRLSIIDLSDLANQPYRNDNYILSYNGEIYNYLELKKRLEVDFGVEFRTTSDTEVLFHLLIERGVDECLKEIRGMFAFAFYDKQSDVLILARDRLGIKPLYYTKRADAFYWSSEMKALANHLGLSPDPTKNAFLHRRFGREIQTEHALRRSIFGRAGIVRESNIWPRHPATVLLRSDRRV